MGAEKPAGGLSEELRDQILDHLGTRLAAGDILVTADQLHAAAFEGYEQLAGKTADETARAELAAAVDEVNARDAGVFVGPGVENWISRTVLAEVRQRGWSLADVMEQGNQAVREFARGAKARALLGQLGLTPKQLNLGRCHRSLVNAVAGRQDPVQRRSAEKLAQVREAARQDQAGAAPAKGGVRVHTRDLGELTGGPEPMPTEEEAQQRTQKEAKTQARIRKAQVSQLIAHLDTYVEMGKITPEDAARLRKLDRVDQAVKSGKASAEQGSKIRNSILTGKVRDRLERQVRDAVDHAVVYAQVFQALGRIETRYDPALRFLARHKSEVNAEKSEDGEAPDLRSLAAALVEEMECLHLLIDLVDRKDAEVRMIAAHLPPYSHIVRRGQERIENLVVEEAFVDDLRQLSEEDLGARLHSDDRKLRSRTAADMLCAIALLNQLIKPTPFRKEIRLLKLNLIVEEFFRGTEDVEDARARAQEFLRTRLRSLYPDISEEESAEIERRGEEIIEAAQQRVLSERREREVEAAGAAGRSQGQPVGESGAAATLTEEEAQQGVQIHRVGMRVAGRLRQVPLKVMPDEDDPSRFVVVQRDPDSGEVVPLMRRGAKRYVQRGRDGSWEMARE